MTTDTISYAALFVPIVTAVGAGWAAYQFGVRQKAIDRRFAFLEKQLTEFYAALCGLRKQIRAVEGGAGAAAKVRSAHQSMHHLVADANWSDHALMAAVTAQVLPALL